jgi:lipoyl(octanoyl) transferase
VPCGIADAGVTSLSEELGRRVTVSDVLPLVERHLADLLAWAPYDPTPDYDARPEPGREPRPDARPEARVPVLGLPG